MGVHQTSPKIGSVVIMLVLAFGFSADGAWAQLGLAGFSFFDGSPETRLGSAIAVGDFNNDGFDDIAVGMPDYDVVAVSSAGGVSIRLGGPGGWSASAVVTSEGLGGITEAFARFGSALATGDFDNDGHDDLVIGVPDRTVSGADSAGEIVVAYGTSKSRSPSQVIGTTIFDTARTQFFSQVALPGAPETNDRFGFSLATGVLSSDGIDDLVIGIPFEDIQGPLGLLNDVGAINVMYGSFGAGLTTSGSQLFNENSPGLGLNANAGERFGFSLAIGQFTDNSHLDLAVGTPGEVVFGFGLHGAVVVFAGTASGLDPVVGTEKIYSQLIDGILGTIQDGDEFGYSLAAGNFDGDLQTDLAIGVPGESELGTTESGAVQVLYGTTDGLSPTGSQFFVESSFDTDVDPFDRLGRALAAGDFDGDGRDDLAIGAPFDDSLGFPNAGEIDVLYGTDNGLVIDGGQVFNMIFFDTLEAGDRFGAALATGRFFSQTAEGQDLAVGVPRRGNGSVVAPTTGSPLPVIEPGAFLVIRSLSIFADGFESGDFSDWSASP